MKDQIAVPGQGPFMASKKAIGFFRNGAWWVIVNWHRMAKEVKVGDKKAAQIVARTVSGTLAPFDDPRLAEVTGAYTQAQLEQLITLHLKRAVISARRLVRPAVPPVELSLQRGRTKRKSLLAGKNE